MRMLWRESLLHFLLLGAGLFFLYDYLNRGVDESDLQTIVVDRGKLLTYLQYRSGVFDGTRFGALLDTLSDGEQQQLIEDYVREEALYREAKALQLDRNDRIARLRLIQQLEFITRTFAEAEVDLTEEEIEEYFKEHRTEYYVSPKVTFTHVFISSERHSAEEAGTRARETLLRLNRERVRFDHSGGHGDRFLYHLNYVAREPEEVASHFGVPMQQAVFALDPSESHWRGPFESSYGFHLVLLIRNDAGHTPPLEEIRSKVEQDAKRAALEARLDESLRSIVQTYKVKVKRDEFVGLQERRSVADEGLQDSTRAPHFIGGSLVRD